MLGSRSWKRHEKKRIKYKHLICTLVQYLSKCTELHPTTSHSILVQTLDSSEPRKQTVGAVTQMSSCHSCNMCYYAKHTHKSPALKTISVKVKRKMFSGNMRETITHLHTVFSLWQWTIRVYHNWKRDRVTCQDYWFSTWQACVFM